MSGKPLSADEKISLNALKGKTKSKLTDTESETLVRLEARHEEWCHSLFNARVDEKVKAAYKRLGDGSEKWNYALREKQADECADITLPPAEQITSSNVAKLRQQLSSVRIQASSLARQARRRASTLKGCLEQLEAEWKGITSIETEWKALAGAEIMLKGLREEASVAQSHADYVTACEKTILQTVLELHWIQQDKLGTRPPGYSEPERPQL